MTPSGPYTLAWRTPIPASSIAASAASSAAAFAGGSGASRSAAVTFGATARLA